MKYVLNAIFNYTILEIIEIWEAILTGRWGAG